MIKTFETLDGNFQVGIDIGDNKTHALWLKLYQGVWPTQFDSVLMFISGPVQEAIDTNVPVVSFDDFQTYLEERV
jgi:hypothetical protein